MRHGQIPVLCGRESIQTGVAGGEVDPAQRGLVSKRTITNLLVANGVREIQEEGIRCSQYSSLGHGHFPFCGIACAGRSFSTICSATGINYCVWKRQREKNKLLISPANASVPPQNCSWAPQKRQRAGEREGGREREGKKASVREGVLLRRG